eukprot:SAG22_NODE_377_length_11521_cov_194.091403_2_plen_98_part_00
MWKPHALRQAEKKDADASLTIHIQCAQLRQIIDDHHEKGDNQNDGLSVTFEDPAEAKYWHDVINDVNEEDDVELEHVIKAEIAKLTADIAANGGTLV